jgi:hypothetical protein
MCGGEEHAAVVKIGRIGRIDKRRDVKKARFLCETGLETDLNRFVGGRIS